MAELLAKLLGGTNSKKERVYYIGVILIALVLWLIPDKAEMIIPWIAGITGAHNIGQGIADGLSGGKTATQPKAPAPAAPPPTN